jgi:hypothetical protein
MPLIRDILFDIIEIMCNFAGMHNVWVKWNYGKRIVIDVQPIQMRLAMHAGVVEMCIGPTDTTAII